MLFCYALLHVLCMLEVIMVDAMSAYMLYRYSTAWWKCMVVIVCSYAQPPTPCQELLLLCCLTATSCLCQDYFNYEKGLGQTSNGRGVSDENQQKILQWLKDNP